MVASVARTSMYMFCLDEIGRDDWVRGGRKSTVKTNPPKNWGKEPSPRETLSGRKSGRPQGKVIVVVVVVVVVCFHLFS